MKLIYSSNDGGSSWQRAAMVGPMNWPQVSRLGWRLGWSPACWLAFRRPCPVRDAATSGVPCYHSAHPCPRTFTRMSGKHTCWARSATSHASPFIPSSSAHFLHPPRRSSRVQAAHTCWARSATSPLTTTWSFLKCWTTRVRCCLGCARGPWRHWLDGNLPLLAAPQPEVVDPSLPILPLRLAGASWSVPVRVTQGLSIVTYVAGPASVLPAAWLPGWLEGWKAGQHGAGTLAACRHWPRPLCLTLAMLLPSTAAPYSNPCR